MDAEEARKRMYPPPEPPKPRPAYLPCPFCGGTNILERTVLGRPPPHETIPGDKHRTVLIQCQSCGACVFAGLVADERGRMKPWNVNTIHWLASEKWNLRGGVLNEEDMYEKP